MQLSPDRYWWLIPTSFVFAFLWQFWPLSFTFRPYMPDAIVTVTLYWVMQRPPRMGGGWALVIGILRDNLTGTALGTHAFALIFVAFWVQLLSERLRSLAIWQQAMLVGLLCLIYQLVSNSIGLWMSHLDAPLFALPSVLITALCWPVCFAILNLLEHGYLHRS